MEHREYIRAREGVDCVVLLIHGILSTPRFFDRFLSAIPQEWDVYNMLLDGHGGTVKDFSRTSMDRWKEQVEDRLTQLCARYKRVVVMGHSMGTLLSIGAAPRHPRVEAMLLLDVPLRVRVKWVMIPRALKAVFGSIDESDPVEAATRSCAGIRLTRRLWQYPGWIPRFLELLRLCRETREKVGDMAVPCHVFQSRLDELVSPRSSEYFGDNPHITHIMLEQSGHFYYPEEDMARIMTCAECLLR